MPFSCAASSASAICLAYSRRRGPAAADLGRRLARHELHHQRAVLDAVDLRDVRVVQRGEHLGFARKAGEPVGVLCQGLGQHLDRDGAIQLRVCARDTPRPSRRRRAARRFHRVRACRPRRGSWGSQLSLADGRAGREYRARAATAAAVELTDTNAHDAVDGVVRQAIRDGVGLQRQVHGADGCGTEEAQAPYRWGTSSRRRAEVTRNRREQL